MTASRIEFPAPTLVVHRDILPIYVISIEGHGEVLSFEGTGFLIAPQLLITCWHCVRTKLAPTQRYAVAAPQTDAYYYLTDIEQDPAGLDLATARVGELEPTLGLVLSLDADVIPGRDVQAYGFPLGAVVRKPDGTKALDVSGRVLRGYVTRIFTARLAEYAPTVSIELDMPVPAGLSGAPLIGIGSTEVTGCNLRSNSGRTNRRTGLRGSRNRQTRTRSAAHRDIWSGASRRLSAGSPWCRDGGPSIE